MLSTIHVMAVVAAIQAPIQQVQVLNFIHPPVRGRDTPGLSCRALLYGDWIYTERSTNSARLGMQRNAVAMTGPTVDGFVPVLLVTGQHGWMQAKAMQFHQPTNYTPHLGHCHATILRNGAARLTWTDQ
ncbi:hypothetical protein [Roseomonas mucosa]|uniref:hypothetical protein n=1 Tax=Roseomonas mucosa TaxID=207340 RepID=UPI0022463C35|nr:hypothetical protein [Roseomonas mucosa]UZO94740.1 Hypothetical protein RMP42_05865 [Roseomonas mucosa]